MFRPIPALLILLVALTSIGLGAARGTILRGQEVVLCTGHGIVVTRLPAPDDGPSGGLAAHLCPDMALSLMVALGDAATGVVERRLAVLDIPAMRGAVLSAAPARDIRVRDPPGGTQALPGKIS